ncbi:DMT family transporter [Caldimonas tepidiphila]|uniref:DMT family transporter n=1 Tax=Caldimonas tepidiphila TaxID=2315841 RepID=UPI000E5B3462|nr:DMT family transporter [Caldimonas tepidiphila]
MVGVTLLWSIAGLVTRQLEAARSFEITFWRSFFNAAFLVVALGAMQGRGLWRSLFRSGWPVWAAGACWGVMFTCFMLALSLTTVANVLVTMALAPLATSLLARAALGHRLPARTWGAIAVAGLGIAWMYGREAGGGDARHLLGTLVALGVPLAAAVNWTITQHISHHASSARAGGARPPDLLPAVLIGAVLSSLASLPLAWPLQASAHDLGLLAGLGVFQLAIPCLIAVRLARVLPAPEIALLSLLEVVFGVAWAWLGAGEEPSLAVLGGGTLVLAALVGNEWLGLRERAARARLQESSSDTAVPLS